MARRLELENSSSYGKISSSTIQPLPHRQEAITCYLSINTTRGDEDPPGLPRRPSDKISGNQGTRTQLQKTVARDRGRKTRMGGGEDHQLPTSWATQEAPIPRSMEGVPTIRRFLGSEVGSFRSGSNRRLLRHTFTRPPTTVI